MTFSATSPPIDVAIKELLRKDAESSEETLEKFDEFKREVYIMSCLRHACLVQVEMGK